MASLMTAHSIINLGQREPNDPQWADPDIELWGHDAVGITEAWETTTGSNEIMVAVVDTGVDLSHEDLVDNLYRHPENPDTVFGYDLIDRDLIPQDENGHGTHIAGVIGAVGNNELGTTGINWNVSILPIRVFDANGQGPSGMRIGPRIQAGAKSSTPAGASLSTSPGPLASAANYVAQNGGLIVASAGNGGEELDGSRNFFPATLFVDTNPNRPILSVGAYAKAGTKTETSNYGTGVDLWAPGRSIWSTLPGNAYGFEQGTSTAAAFVSGVAALYASAAPDTTGGAIAAKLKETGQEVEGLDGKTLSAALALREGLPPTVAPIVTSVTPLPDAQATVTWDYNSAVRPKGFEALAGRAHRRARRNLGLRQSEYHLLVKTTEKTITVVNDRPTNIPLAARLAEASVGLVRNKYLEQEAPAVFGVLLKVLERHRREFVYGQELILPSYQGGTFLLALPRGTILGPTHVTPMFRDLGWPRPRSDRSPLHRRHQ